MNLLRAGSILLLALAISLASMGQSHDESYGSHDLIKSTQVYPNPASDYLYIKFENPIAKNTKLIVHSIIGNQIDTENEAIDEYEIRLRVKDLNTGYYIIAVHDQSNNTRGTFKFLKR